MNKFDQRNSAHGQKDALDRLQKIASQVPGVVYQFRLRPDGSSCFPFASEAIRDIYRLSPEEVREDAAKVFAVLHPDDYAGIVASIQKSAQDLTPWQHEYRVKFDDGVVRWLFGNALPQREADGSTLWHGFITDITGRKMVEKELQESRNQLQATLDAIPDILFEMGLDGRYYDCRSSHPELLVVPAEAFAGKTAHDIFPPEAANVVMSALREAYEKGGSQGKQIELSLPQGAMWFDFSIARKHGIAGQEPRFIVLSRDITERKQAEEELRIAATAFETQEGMMVTDAHNVILRVNRAFTEITGYTAEEAIGQTPRLLSSGRHDAAFYAAMWKCIRYAGVWQGEIWNRRKNGEVYPERLTITAVKDDAGGVTHYVATLHDITERKAAEEEINNLAFYDTLTQLPNRRLLDDRLSKAMAASKRSGHCGALMFLDLDNFKPLNDTYGHGVGDLLLVEVAHRLTGCVREVDTVARFGGDEFVVILSELDEDKDDSTAQAGIVAEKIRITLAKPYLLTFKHEGEVEKTVEHRCAVSIGVVVFNSEVDAEDIIRWADIAMYQAKDSGRNSVHFFEHESGNLSLF